MDQQKQWLFGYYELGNIQQALLLERTRMEAPELAHLVSHTRQINELIEKITAIMVATERDYGDGSDEDGVISEQLLVTLVPKYINERWEEPYTVIPVGSKWSVADKHTLGRPVGEKLYTQSTHAYRACRRLNAAFWENEGMQREKRGVLEAKGEK